jgi:ATP-dependent Zn protease
VPFMSVTGSDFMEMVVGARGASFFKGWVTPLLN